MNTFLFTGKQICNSFYVISNKYVKNEIGIIDSRVKIKILMC